MGRCNAAQGALLWGCESVVQQELHSPETSGQREIGANLQWCRLVVQLLIHRQASIAAESG